MPPVFCRGIRGQYTRQQTTYKHELPSKQKAPAVLRAPTSGTGVLVLERRAGVPDLQAQRLALTRDTPRTTTDGVHLLVPRKEPVGPSTDGPEGLVAVPTMKHVAFVGHVSLSVF